VLNELQGNEKVKSYEVMFDKKWQVKLVVRPVDIERDLVIKVNLYETQEGANVVEFIKVQGDVLVFHEFCGELKGNFEQAVGCDVVEEEMVQEVKA